MTVEPLPPFVGRNFVVRWSGSDQGPAGIAHYDVQYRVDGGPWTDWRMGVTFTQDEFTGGEDGRFYEFRARGVDNAGNVEAFGGPEASTTADFRPPSSRVNPLPALTRETTFTVSWTGSDAGSGIQYFDVRYRLDGGDWVPWQQQTTAASALFTTMIDGIYDFEVRAVDNVGLQEAFTGQAEATIVVDAREPFIIPRLWFPFVAKQ